MKTEKMGEGTRELIEHLGRTLRTQIPVTDRLYIKPVSYDGSRLVLCAPLIHNSNDKGTAFAGSLGTIVTLAGWSAIWLMLHEAGIKASTVIQQSTIRYLRPVTGDFDAACSLPVIEQRREILAELSRTGKARMRMDVEILENEEVAVSFRGYYVIKTSGSFGKTESGTRQTAARLQKD